MVLSVSCKGAENIHFIFISFVDVHIKQPGEFKRFLFFLPFKNIFGVVFQKSDFATNISLCGQVKQNVQKVK